MQELHSFLPASDCSHTMAYFRVRQESLGLVARVCVGCRWWSNLARVHPHVFQLDGNSNNLSCKKDVPPVKQGRWQLPPLSPVTVSPENSETTLIWRQP